jgi:hypothetical protein
LRKRNRQVGEVLKLSIMLVGIDMAAAYQFSTLAAAVAGGPILDAIIGPY